jgi:cytochrome c biogenesis protein
MAVDTRDPSTGRRSGELTLVELLRWCWRQLTSMRTALILLLLLALAAIPGSVIPQEEVDSLKASQWQDAHPQLTPIYERLGLFDVFGSPWFAAIYLLLTISLVGCFVPRIGVYAEALRSQPPATPRRLDRLPDHATYRTNESPEEVLDRARTLLRGHRIRPDEGGDSVAAERGYLREAGNLLFHVSVLVVMAGFAIGSLFGYQGGMILVVGNGMSNNLTQYDDFNPGSLFGEDDLDEFYLDIEDFDVEWIETGRAQGQARKFVSHVRYAEGDEEPQEYDLRVNHPLTIGDTSVFLIGHGYAPVITVRDGNGDIAYSGPTVFLPEDSSFRSIGVVKAPDAQPRQIGLEGWLFPTYAFTEKTGPFSVFGDAKNPVISAWTPALLSRSTCWTSPAWSGWRTRTARCSGSTSPSVRRSTCRTARAASPSSGSSAGTSCRSARPRVGGWPWSVSSLPCSGCWPRCSSGRAGPGCAPDVTSRAARTSRWRSSLGPAGMTSAPCWQTWSRP